MTPVVAAAIVALCAIPFLQALPTLLKGFPVSDAFKNALAALKAYYENKLAAAQADNAALQAQITAVQGAAAQVDAEATAEIVAATPTE